MLTRTAGIEFGPPGITVVGVGPGAVATAINVSTMEDPEKMKPSTRRSRWGGWPSPMRSAVWWPSSLVTGRAR